MSDGPREELDSVAASHAAVAEWLRSHDDVDPTTPSLLPDWTVGHVMTHIARNGDSILPMLAGHPQYPHGRDGRNADIEAGAGRPWGELVDDVTASAVRVDEAFAAVEDWSGSVQFILGDRPKAMVPFLRQREVEIHRIDLGLGYGFDDLPADYVRRELRAMEMLYRSKRPMGHTDLPAEALAAAPAQRLAWLAGRATIDGLPPAGIF